MIIVVRKNTTSTGITVGDEEEMHISSGGVANNTTVEDGGSMYISSGGVASDTTVNDGGKIDIWAGGAASDTILNSGGSMYISSGGVANSTTVSYGFMHISSGGVANDTTINSYHGSMHISSGGVANSTTVNEGNMYISSGGVANSTTVDSGYMYISSGGVANNTTINSATAYDFAPVGMNIFSGGVANSTTVNSGGSMRISSGGVANSTTVNSGGYMYISSGGVASDTTVNDGGKIDIWAGGAASDTILNSGGWMNISGGTAIRTDVKSGGFAGVYSSGVANSTVLNSGGRMYVSHGGIAEKTQIESGGWMYIYFGGTHRGSLMIEDGGEVSVERGAVIDFTVSGRKTTDGYLINDLSRIKGEATYTITVSDNLTTGTYKLAQGAGSFKGSITINNETEEIGKITVNGSAVKYGDSCTYSLVQKSGNLTLVVKNTGFVPPPDITYDDILPGVPAAGEIGGSGETIKYFQWQQDTAGKFVISGDFGNLNASVAVKNEKNKTVASGTIKKGILTFNGNKSVLLDKGDYTIILKNTDNGKTSADYSFVIAAEVLYDKIDNSDDWTDVKTAGADGAVAKTIGNLTAETEIGNWVGFGDAADYHEFTLTDDTKLNLNITSTDAAKVVICKLNENKNGTFSLKALQSTTVAAGYTLTTKDLLLENGTYYIGVTSTNAKKGGNADYTITVDESSKFFSKVDNSDDWTDVKTNGAAGAVGKIDGDFKIGTTLSDWVGYGDASDYKSFTITEDMTVSFDVKSSDAAKFNLYTLNENKNGTFSLKSLLSASVSAGQTVPTKTITLAAGTYYIGMTSTNAKKGGDADYTITVKDPNATVIPVIDNTDDWTDLKTEGINGKVAELGTLDENIKKTGWVGTDDAVDYMTFTLDNAASLSFDVSSTDAAKFVVYELKESYNKKTGETTFSLKALQTTTIKAGYTIPTKNLLLESGKTYAIGVTSTNAKKGGSAEYSFVLNDNTTFFTKADNSDDVFTDAEQINITSGVADGWVGYSDSVDYMEFTLDTAAKLNFDVASSDSAKFVIYQLNDKTGKLKALQTTTIKADTVMPTKDLFLAAGTYYISVTSTNAKKGGNADYSFSLNDSSVFYLEAGDNSDDTWKLVQEDDAAALDGANINGWVGYSDAADFVKLELDGSGAISLELDDVTATAYERKELKITCVDEKGKALALTYDAATESLTSNLTFTEGTVCYVGVSTTDQKKYDTEYQITAGILA